MNGRSLRVLAIIVIGLIALLVAIEKGDDAGSLEDGTLLFPEMRERIDEVTSIEVTKSDYDSPVSIVRSDGQWTVSERDHYPASIAKVRDVLLAMVNARAVEVKTANPERHHNLGLRAPDVEGSKGTQVIAAGDGFSYGIIFGNTTRVDLRYVRKVTDDQSWLVDQNPSMPNAIGDWLLTEIIDIDSADISSVTITHADGDTIVTSKGSDDSTEFTVADVPEGRELSYATVANGIAGALSDLQFDDVQRADEKPTSTETVFETTGGLIVTVFSQSSEDGNWVTLAVSTIESAGADTIEQVAAINKRVGGWQYSLPDYKFNLLTRQWEDILKAPPEQE